MATVRLLAVALSLRSGGAGAADPGFSVALEYEVSPSTGCPEAGAFRGAVARHLGYDPFRESAPLRVAVRVGESPRGIEGVVDWRDADGTWRGERRFLARDGNCSQLLVEMSFSVTIQIQFLQAGPTAAPAIVPPPPPPRPPAPAAAMPSAWQLGLGGGPSLGWAVSPSLSAALRAFVAARRRAISLEIGAIATLPSTFDQPGGSGFRQSIVASSAAACGHLKALSACALGQLGGLRISGFGVDRPLSRTGFLAQAGLRLAAAVPLGPRWAVMTHVDALGLLSPWRVELNQIEVWRMPRLGVLAGIDLAVRFP